MKPKTSVVYVGDVFEKLKKIPNNSIDCIITSPPYYGVRDYGTLGQWGLEPDFRIYLVKMQVVIDEFKRILKKSGSFWLNIGDSYGGTTMHADWTSIDPSFSSNRLKNGGFTTTVVKPFPKSLIGIPSRLFTYCIDSGWKARNFIPWEKNNPMPSSVKDRLSNVWEPVFFFTKSERYYSNLDEIREPLKTKIRPSFNLRVREAKNGKNKKKYGNNFKATKAEKRSHNDKGEKKQDQTIGADGKPKVTYKGFNNRWTQKRQRVASVRPPGTARNQHSGIYDKDGNLLINPKGKNPGDVFHINVRPFKGAHFATFPPKLPEKIIKFAVPKNGIVLDPFFGAGTVGLVAQQLGRKWIGIDLKREYAELAIQRIGAGKIVQ